MLIKFSEKDTDLSDEQPLKADASILATFLPIDTDSSAVDFMKICSGNEVTLSPISN